MPRPARQQAAGGVAEMVAFVAYYRVSTDRQGRSGLGLDAQKEAADVHVRRSGGRLVGEFAEVESGKRSDRPQLAAALAACRAKRATLLVAKVDRLARNTAFLLSVVEGCGDAGVTFCDLPQIPVGPLGKFFLTLMAAVAELEAGMISARTRAALAAARARGVRLGNPSMQPGILSPASEAGHMAQTDAAIRAARDIRPFVDAARSAGALSLRQIADALTARGVKTPAGGATWHAAQVKRVMDATGGIGAGG